MNQILSVGEKPQNRNEEINKNVIQKQKEPVKHIESIQRANMTSNKADLAKVIRIFCISIIIFGLLLVGKSTYALISNREKLEDNVQVEAEQMGRETKITIESGLPIKEFSYKWNAGEPVNIEGNGTVLFETVIQIPNGNNILNMTVTDYYGNKKNFQEQYIYDSLDVNKPTIEIEVSGNKFNIKATDDNEMSYITYSWNDDEAERVDVDKNNLQEINIDIEVPEGENKLTIIAVDKEGNRETRTENILGDTKPTFSLTKDGLKLILKASDDEGLSKISMTVDGETRDSGENPINQKEATAQWEVTPGVHTISVEVINVNGLKATGTVTAEI